MKFITEIWHPNVDKNGDVCISILHEPGEDKYGYEKPEERWLPIHTVETIMISVISMLADPNGDSPANVDAAYFQKKNGGKTDTVNLSGKLLVVYERAKRLPLSDIHPAACSFTIFRGLGMGQGVSLLLALEEHEDILNSCGDRVGEKAVR
ncbi:hypothetical protein NFI96_011703, partial [Prochilodus magdalenae]